MGLGLTLGAGSSLYANGVFTVSGAGADIQGFADAFRFDYMTVTGDCTIIARVAFVQNIDPWSKAGVMIRASLDPGETNAFIAVPPSSGVTWQRPTSSASVAIGVTNAPGQLKFSWPTDHTGWQLQAQTNTLASGLGTNWVDVPGSMQTNQMAMPLNATSGAVFFRLLRPY